MLYLVFLTSLASAEFLTPVKDQDDVTLPKMCEEDTVISCTLVHIDLDCLNNDTPVFNDTTLTFLDQPGNDSFTFSSSEGETRPPSPWTRRSVQCGGMLSWPTPGTSSLSPLTWTPALDVTC